QDILTVAVDGTVDFPTGLTSMSGTNRSFTGQGWQNLPGGLILQWGTCTYLASYGAAGQVFNLPKGFPNGILSIVGCDAGSGAHRVGMQPLSKSTFSAWGGAYTGYLDTTIRYIAIGY
ncbi:MAG TPA: hypothetical protein VFM18_23640, partial [Methanosarcina sp.]|nr:hypothetical protein [Methanosarcina sp.]